MRTVWGVLGCLCLSSCGRSLIEFDVCAPSSRFAAYVESWDPLFAGGPAPTQEEFIDPEQALGPPDYFPPEASEGEGSVSLGQGGELVLGFEGCLLANDGTAAPDIDIHEVGRSVERSFVFIRPTPASAAAFEGLMDERGFVFLGAIGGSFSTVDIDLIRPDSDAGELRFSAVRIVDDPSQGGVGSGSAGADIDAVELISFWRE